MISFRSQLLALPSHFETPVSNMQDLYPYGIFNSANEIMGDRNLSGATELY